MQHLILTIVLFFLSIIMQAQDSQENLEVKNITVAVTNALGNHGNVKFALFNEEGFRKQPLVSISSTVEKGVCSTVFEKVPRGVYAIICFQDENNNNRIDFNENGMPKESYGASNNALNFGPPQFQTAKFELAEDDLKLEIKF